MFLEEQLRDVLVSPSPQLPVGMKVYPDIAEQGALAPYVVYSRVSTMSWKTVSGGGGIDRVRIQVDVHAKTRMQTSTISKTIRELIEGLRTDVTYLPFLEDQTDGYDDDTDLYVRSSDFICWERLP